MISRKEVPSLELITAGDAERTMEGLLRSLVEEPPKTPGGCAGCERRESPARGRD